MKKIKILSICLVILLIVAMIIPNLSFAVTDYGKNIDFDQYKGSGEESQVLKDKAENIKWRSGEMYQEYYVIINYL